MLGFSPSSSAPLSSLPSSLLPVTADANITQDANTVSADTSVIVTANFSATQSGNTITADGLVTTPSSADANITQADNTIISAAGVLVSATAVITQDGNTVISYVIPGIGKHSSLASLHATGTNSSLIPHTQKASLTVH